MNNDNDTPTRDLLAMLPRDINLPDGIPIPPIPTPPPDPPPPVDPRPIGRPYSLPLPTQGKDPTWRCQAGERVALMRDHPFQLIQAAVADGALELLVASARATELGNLETWALANLPGATKYAHGVVQLDRGRLVWFCYYGQINARTPWRGPVKLESLDGRILACSFADLDMSAADIREIGNRSRLRMVLW